MADSERDRLSFQREPQPIALPSVKVADPGLQSFLDAMKAAIEALANGRGGLANQAITWGAAYRQGLVVLRDTQGNAIRPPGGTLPPVEPPQGPITDVPPPAPTGVTASGGLGVILLSWNAPDSRRVAYAEIFSSDNDDISAAVKIGESFGSSDVTYRDVVGAGATRYYWVRFVGWGALALRGPFQSTAGVFGETSANPSYLLDLLDGAITESQLANTLASRINLIDAPATTALSVNQRIQAGDDALSQQIALLTAGANQTFDQFKLWAFDASAESWTATNATLAWVAGWLTYTSASGVVSLTSPTLTGGDVINGSAYQQVRFRLKRKAGTGWGVTLRWYRSATWYSVTVPDATIADEDTETVVVDLSANADWVGQSISRVELQLDSATGSVYELDWFAIGRDGPAASYAALQQEITARANADSATASSISTLQATVDGKASTVALQDEASVRATNDGYLYAQKFVKIDVNGFITGYGIAASNNTATGTPESEFIVRANRFAVVPPSGATGQSAPFYFQATPTTINGVAVPAGLYVSSAFIANGSIGTAQIGLAQIDNARIADVAADKLTSGDIQVGRYIQSTGFAAGSTGWRINGDGTAEFAAASIRGQLTAAQINANGLVIRDTNGTPILGSGVGLDWGRIINQPGGIYNSNISIGANGALSGGGGGQVTLGGLGAGALAFISQITAGNAGTYIANAAIGNALIGKSIFSDDFNGSVDANGTITGDGTAGWVIGKAGRAVFSNVKVRGDVQATSLNGQIVGAGNMPLNTVNLITIGEQASYLSVLSGGNVGQSSFTTAELFPNSYDVSQFEYTCVGHCQVTINHPSNALQLMIDAVGQLQSQFGGSQAPWTTFEAGGRFKDMRTVFRQSPGSVTVFIPWCVQFLSSGPINNPSRFRTAVTLTLFSSDHVQLSTLINNVSYVMTQQVSCRRR